MKSLLTLVSNRNGLGASHLRVLMVLRETNASCAVVAMLTGLSKNRTGERLHEMEVQGIVTRLEHRSDRTVIWGLSDAYRPIGLPTVPMPGQRVRSEAGSGKSPLDQGLELLKAAIIRQQKQKATESSQVPGAEDEEISRFNLGDFEDDQD